MARAGTAAEPQGNEALASDLLSVGADPPGVTRAPDEDQRDTVRAGRWNGLNGGQRGRQLAEAAVPFDIKDGIVASGESRRGDGIDLSPEDLLDVLWYADQTVGMDAQQAILD